MSKHSKADREGTEQAEPIEFVSVETPDGVEAVLNAIFGDNTGKGWGEVQEYKEGETPLDKATDVEILPAHEADAISVFFGTKKDGSEELVFSFQKGKQQLLVAFNEATYRKFKEAEAKSVGLHAEAHGKRFGSDRPV